MPRLLITDDSIFARGALKKALSSGGFEIVCQTPTAQSTIEQYVALQPDAVLMDISTVGSDGARAVGAILALDPAAKIVVFGASDESAAVERAVRVGASGIGGPPHSPESVVLHVKQLLRD